MDKRNWLWFLFAGIVVVSLILIGWFFFNGWSYGNQSILNSYRGGISRGGFWGSYGCCGGVGFGRLGSIFSLLIPLGFILMIGFGVAAMIRGSFSQTKHMNVQTKTGSALDILKSRYASGEITREQYQEMRKDLL